MPTSELTHLITPFTILRDIREQHGWTFRDISSDAKDGGLPWLVKIRDAWLGDHQGDYTIEGLDVRRREAGEQLWHLSIERKSLEDFCGTIWGRREQFEQELSQLNKMRLGAVIVEAEWSTIWQYTPIHWEMEGVPERTRQHRRKILTRSVMAWQQDGYFPRVHWWFLPGARAAELVAFRVLERFWRTQSEAIFHLK